MADEKYRLQLEGSQVDDALLQMNQRIPEGWAVGTRDGSPVGPGSQFHQNNAKYYAEQAGGSLDAANAAAARAEAAVPAGTEGAVFFTVDQSDIMTEAQKAVVRKNIRAGNTNPNLLRNWYFLKPVNLRGKTSYAANGYGVDGWVCYGGTQTLNANGITVPANGVMTQPTDNLTQLNGKTLTMSILYDTGMETGTATLDLSGSTMFINNGAAGQAYVTSGGLVQFYKGTQYTVKAVKLEIGSVSTLAQDGEPNYGEELTKCIYSKADPSDPYANNGFGRSNRNLLDNWYFVGGGSQSGDGVFPINQRGTTFYSLSYGNIFDRWHMQGSATATCTLNANGIAFAADTENCGLSQTIPAGRIVDGKTYTLSVMDTAGNIYSGSRVLNTNGSWQNFDLGLSAFGWYNPCYVAANGQTNVYILDRTGSGGSASIGIAAAKLELGTVSTLANDVPPDFGEELRKCQRYLYVLNAPAYPFLGEVALAGDATNCTIGFHLPAEMRTTAPSVTLTSGLWVGGAQTTAVNWTRTMGTTVVAACTVTDGLSGSTLYAVATGASATTITISAEL